VKRAITACNLGPKAPGGTPSGRSALRGVAASIAALSVHLMLGHVRLHGRDLDDLMALRLPDLGPSPRWQLAPALLARCRPVVLDLVHLLGWQQLPAAPRVSGLTAGLPGRSASSSAAASTPGGSVDGGFEEFCESWFSLASNLATISSRRWTWLRSLAFSARASSIVVGVCDMSQTPCLPPADRQLFALGIGRPQRSEDGRCLPTG